MSRTDTPMRDLGLTTTKAVIRDVLTQARPTQTGRLLAGPTQAGRPLAGMRVLDVGTGNGALLRWLLREGADGFGVEPNAGLLRAAVTDRERPAPPGRWLAGKAERLPLRGASVDVVLFFNSLHHVAVTRQVAALAEAARCLRPAGALVVIEPVAAGSYFELLAPLDDETRVRAAAQAALEAVRGRLFAVVEEARFTTTLAFPDVGAVVASFTRADPARAAAASTVMPEIAERFQALGESEPDGATRFVQPMTLHHFERS